MTRIVQVLQKEHVNMAALVKTLEREIDAFEKGGIPDYDILRGALDYFLSFPDLYHHPKEDLIYAKLKQRDPKAATAVGDLRHEHEDLAARTREFAAGLQAVLDEAQVPRQSLVRWAQAFIQRQWQHMRIEEEVFFPAALEVLTDEDWADLETRMTDKEDPLFGDNVGERFESLRQSIMRWQAESSSV